MKEITATISEQDRDTNGQAATAPTPCPAKDSPARPARRPFFKRKSDWCQWEMDQIQAQYRETSADYIAGSDWRAIGRKSSLQATLNQREADWRRRRDYYLSRGM